jgi:hypothetical protein
MAHPVKSDAEKIFTQSRLDMKKSNGESVLSKSLLAEATYTNYTAFIRRTVEVMGSGETVPTSMFIEFARCNTLTCWVLARRRLAGHPSLDGR